MFSFSTWDFTPSSPRTPKSGLNLQSMRRGGSARGVTGNSVTFPCFGPGSLLPCALAVLQPRTDRAFIDKYVRFMHGDLVSTGGTSVCVWLIFMFSILRSTENLMHGCWIHVCVPAACAALYSDDHAQPCKGHLTHHSVPVPLGGPRAAVMRPVQALADLSRVSCLGLRPPAAWSGSVAVSVLRLCMC